MAEVKPLVWIKSPRGYVEVYANLAHLQWSLDDVRVRVAQITDSPETPTPGADWRAAAEERAAITFSWRNAKLLRDQLSQLIENYEKANGEIKLNPSLATTPGSVIQSPKNAQ